MSRNIDERIVKMHFDNAQFEKNAHQSIKTLDELRSGLDLEGAVDSFGQISKATSKQLGLKQTARSANIFSKSLSSVGKVVKGTFSALAAPIRIVSNGLSDLGKYTRTVLGFNIADRLVNSAEAMARAFTIDPLRTGMQEYELLVDSTKTIMTGSVKTYTEKMKKANSDFVYNEAEHLTYVNAEIQKLNKYADDTIYRFSDMTSNVGKFTNVGVELEDATRAMMGIANATAYAGQGAQQASMAMYNLSQSMGMGYLETRDWRSLENANVATTGFRQALVDSGVALGKLEKVGDKVFVKGNKNVEVTADNIRETFSEKWATKEVMMAVFDIFSGEMDAATLGALYGFSAEQADYWAKVGQDAKKAATEVRTYSKMMEALKEAAQSGWSESWKYIIGDLAEATYFWTGLNERFSKIINNQAEARNKIILGWRGLRKNEKGEIEKIEGALDYRVTLIASFRNMLDAFSSVNSGFKTAWHNIFGNITSETLIKLTNGFHDFSVSFKSWFGTLDDSKSRISKISSILEGVFSLLNLGKDMVVEAGKRGLKIIKDLLPESGKVLDSLLPVANWFKKLSEQFKKDKSFRNLFKTVVTDMKTQFNRIKPKLQTFFSDFKKTMDEEGVGAAFKQAKDSIKQALTEWGIDTTSFTALINKITEPFKNLGKTILEVTGIDLTGFQEWWGKIKETISNLGKKDVKDSVAGDTDGVQEASSDLDKAASIFENLKESVTKFIDFVKTSDWTELANTFSSFVSELGVGLMILGGGATAVGVGRTTGFAGNIVKNVGKLIKGLRNTEVTIGDVTIETRDGLGGAFKTAKETFSDALKGSASTVNVLFKFGASMWLLSDAISKLASLDDTDRQQAELAIGVLAGLVVAFDSITKLSTKKIGTKSGANLGGLIGFIFSIMELVDAVVKLTEIDTNKWDSVGIVGVLTGLVSAFDAITKLTSSKIGKKGASLVGIIGYVVALHELVKEISTLTEIDANKWEAVGIEAVLTGLIGAFDAITKLSSSKIGKKGSSVTGLIGFSVALRELVSSIAQITEIESGKWEAVGITAVLTGIIGAFDTVSKLTSDKIGSKGASVTGLIGFVIGLESLIGAIVKLTNIKEGKWEAVGIVAILSGIMGTFDTITKLSTQKIGIKTLDLGMLLGFTGAINTLVNSVAKLTEIDKNKWEAVGIEAVLTGIIGAFDTISQLSANKIGAKGASLTGLIGFAVALNSLVSGIAKLTEIDANKWEAVGIEGVLTGIILAFTGISELESSLIGSSFTGALSQTTGLIGFALALSTLVNSIVTLSSIPKENVDNVLPVLGALEGLILAFSGVSETIDATIGSKTGVVRKIGNDVSGILTTIGMLIGVMGLVIAAKQLAEMDQNKLDKAVETISIFTGITAAFAAVIASLGQLGVIGGIKASFSAALAIGVFSVMLVGIFAGISALLDVIFGNDNVIDKLNDAAEMMKAIGKILGNFVAGIIEPIAEVFTGPTKDIATNTVDFARIGTPLKTLSDQGASLNMTGIENFKTALLSLADLGNTKVNGVAWYSGLMAGEQDITSFAGQLPGIGQNLKDFHDALGDADYGKVQSAANSVKLLAEAMQAYSNSQTDQTMINSLVRFLNVFSGNATEDGSVFDWSKFTFNFDGLSDSMNKGISEAAEGLDADSIVDKIVESILSGKERVQQAISSIVTIPMGSETTSEQVQAAGDAVENVSDQVESTADMIEMVFSGLKEYGYDVSELGDDWRGAIADGLQGYQFGDFLPEGFADLNSLLGWFGIGGNTMAEAGKEDGTAYGQSFIASMASILGLSNTASVTPTVAPVIDQSGLGGLNITNGLLNLTGTVTIDASQIASVTEAIRTAQVNIVNSVDNVANRVDNLESAIRSMSVILDTGIIAGAVDTILGGRSVTHSRSGYGGH